MKKTIQPETIRNNILKLLKNRNWTQADLDKRIGGTKNASNIIRGISKYPRIEVLQRIANAFDVEVGTLIAETNNNCENIDYSLLSDAFTKTVHAIKSTENKYNLTPEKILSLTAEVYNYTRKLELNNIETKFVDWIISKNCN